MIATRRICLIALTLPVWLLGGCASTPDESPDADPYQSVFTTDLDEDDYPVDDVDEVSMKDDGQVILYTGWLMSAGPHRIVTTVRDDSGRTLVKNPYEFNADGSEHYTWYEMTLRPPFHRPGLWTFTVDLDGEEYVEKELRVLP